MSVSGTDTFEFEPPSWHRSCNRRGSMYTVGPPPAVGGGVPGGSIGGLCIISGPLPERRRSEPAPKPPKHLFRFGSGRRRVSIGPTTTMTYPTTEVDEEEVSTKITTVIL